MYILGHCVAIPGGGVAYSNYFLTGCAARGLKPLPISKDFSPSKNGWFKAVFFEIFANRDPFLRVFLRPQNGWFYHFLAIFAKWDPLLRIFLTKMGPMSKDFCWKSNLFGRHIPICLNMWIPHPGCNCPMVVLQRYMGHVATLDTLFWNIYCSKPICVWNFKARWKSS